MLYVVMKHKTFSCKFNKVDYAYHDGLCFCGERGNSYYLGKDDFLMKHSFRIACTAISVAALVVMFFASAPASAYAATQTSSAAKHAQQPLTHCWESACNGSDPYSVGCAGGSAQWKVLLSAYIRNGSGTIQGYVQLWYSTTCDTNWARVYNYTSSNEYTEVSVGDYPSPTLDDFPCTDRLPDCQDIRTYQYWIPGKAFATGNTNGYVNSVHQ
jgi:hypothetical protein